MRKTLLSFGLLMILGAMTTSADGGQYLHIRTASGWSVLDLDQVDRLTFNAGTMVASDADNKTVETFDRGALSDMYFDESAGVQAVTADNTEATFSYNNGVATMLTDGPLEVYAVDGSMLVCLNARRGETVDLSAIRNNVIVLKSGSYTLKATLR